MIDVFAAPTPNEWPRTYEFDALLVRFESSSTELLLAIDRIMYRRSHSLRRDVPPIEIRVRHEDFGWSVTADLRPGRILPSTSAVAKVAETAIALACEAVAERKPSMLVTGAVLEFAGVGLALVGRDLDSARTLALHLHARRWAAVSFGHAFLSRSTLEIAGLPSLTAVSSASIDNVPRTYRRAIEASNWYDAGRHLTFYAVDPFVAGAERKTSTNLRAVLVIDGAIDDDASFAEFGIDAGAVLLERHPMAASVRVAHMTLGAPIASCNAIERWFSAGRSAR